MLLYKQGRFYAGGIPFVLPDNSCLVIFEAQNYYENGLEITDPQESMVIDISLDHAELPSKDFLDNSSHIWVMPYPTADYRDNEDHTGIITTV